MVTLKFLKKKQKKVSRERKTERPETLDSLDLLSKLPKTQEATRHEASVAHIKCEDSLGAGGQRGVENTEVGNEEIKSPAGSAQTSLKHKKQTEKVDDAAGQSEVRVRDEFTTTTVTDETGERPVESRSELTVGFRERDVQKQVQTLTGVQQTADKIEDIRSVTRRVSVPPETDGALRDKKTVPFTGRKLSVSPVMDILSESCRIVCEGALKPDALQTYVTPDQLEDVRSLKTQETVRDMRHVTWEQLDRGRVRDELAERQSGPEERHGLSVEQESPDQASPETPDIQSETPERFPEKGQRKDKGPNMKSKRKHLTIDLKSETPQRFILSDDIGTDAASTGTNIPLKQVTGQLTTYKSSFNEDEIQTKTETEVEDTPTETLVRDKPPTHQEAEQGRSTGHRVQAQTDSVKDVYLPDSPTGVSKQRQTETKAQRTPAVITEEQEVRSDTAHRLVPSENRVIEASQYIYLQKSTEDKKQTVDQTENIQVLKDLNVETCGDKTVKVTSGERNITRAKECCWTGPSVGDTETDGLTHDSYVSDGIVTVRADSAAVSPVEAPNMELQHPEIKESQRDRDRTTAQEEGTSRSDEDEEQEEEEEEQSVTATNRREEVYQLPADVVTRQQPSVTDKLSSDRVQRETYVPQRDTSVLQRDTSVPQREPSVPQREPSVPQRETSIPQRETTKTSVPQRNTSVTQRDTSIPLRYSSSRLSQVELLPPLLPHNSEPREEEGAPGTQPIRQTRTSRGTEGTPVCPSSSSSYTSSSSSCTSSSSLCTSSSSSWGSDPSHWLMMSCDVTHPVFAH
ncbi:microtubule-associated protein 1B-like [Brachyistius frenatus]|uniref:microtubule-associated protein 1B-like n=1 Tax=Brachyistius frenatus TaxID=100188 RepID=UPI0037E72004